ncbi:hypothetical protein E2562_001173 [Oryza meyeriana var. granulata]|uniref:DUF7812 domain-containing protein n=1 Tax=Oryza meyeriana var. granulata TaxID=110450 RepID=A0A6G1DC06_9ORYZ|nr:hypothetical protein E2562_001173 [Oryza meyeriana var. granulata]
MAVAGELEGARRLSDLAFDELSRRDLSPSAGPPPADLPPLLRLCLLLLARSADSDLAYRRCTRLLAFLGGILSRDPGPSLLPALEVFIENLVFSDKLMSCFTEANAAMLNRSGVTSVGSRCHDGHLFVMELMTHHFISSVQDEERFFSTLSWSAKAKLEIPEIGLLGALALLRRSCLLYIPATIQAHFLLLACRCAGDGDLGMHLLAFEHAMNVYLSYIPALGVFRRTNGVKSPLSFFIERRPLNSCIQGATHQKLTWDINSLVLFCKLHSNDDLCINDSDIFDFIEENQQVLHEQFRQEIVTDLKRVMSKVFAMAKQEEIDKLDPNVSEEIICLAAALRLMGSSFLRIMHGIGKMTMADASQTTNCLEPYKVYNFISETICLLGHYETNELQRNDLFDTIGKPVDREQGSMLMLSHFATLSVHCLRMRFGFMWKGCIFMMMMAMNQMRTVELFNSHFDDSKESEVCCTGQDGTSKGSVPKKYSTAIALRFKNIQKVYIQDKLGHDFGEGCR